MSLVVVDENQTMPLLAQIAQSATFLGLLCQCYFGQHLVGASNKLAKVDLDMISGTCYLLDASVLLCLLAEGGEVHKFTSKLITDRRRAVAVHNATRSVGVAVAAPVHWPGSLATLCNTFGGRPASAVGEAPGRPRTSTTGSGLRRRRRGLRRAGKTLIWRPPGVSLHSK